MDTINKIRRDSKSIDSINQFARKHNCSWATAKKLIISDPEKLSIRGTRQKKKFTTAP